MFKEKYPLPKLVGEETGDSKLAATASASGVLSAVLQASSDVKGLVAKGGVDTAAAAADEEDPDAVSSTTVINTLLCAMGVFLPHILLLSIILSAPSFIVCADLRF
jgi:hypothetical protein